MLTLRPFQRAALDALVRPGHLICVSATGSGKSLIYERLAAEHGRRLLLVTPLIALARQQAERLRAVGVVTALGAGSYAEHGRTETPDAATGAWIVSPEMLRPDPTGRRRGRLREWRPDVLVVDECHCLWDWGWDFRPAFRELPALLTELGLERSLWLTATLPPDARADLRTTLPAPLREQGEFRVPPGLELTLARIPWPDRAGTLARWSQAQAREGAGLVFTGSREGSLRVARLLEAAGLRAAAYHAGLGQEERRAIESALRAGRLEVVVATSAFGMGMDFPQLRWVALWQAAPSLLALAQAIGRVARADARGRALVLWEEEDFRLLRWLTRGDPRRERALGEMAAWLEGPGCPRRRLEGYFGGKGVAPAEGRTGPPDSHSTRTG